MNPLRVGILSPHRDDAAFSCGLTMLALLRAGAHVTVVNVFTQSDYAVDLSTVDARLPLVEGVSRARLEEDRRFLADLLVVAGSHTGLLDMHDFDWQDAPLRLAVPTEAVLHSPLDASAVGREAEQLAEACRSFGSFDVVFAPLALGDHIDHRVTREAAGLLEACVCLYEDLPYAARLTSWDRESHSVAVMRSNRSTETVRCSVRLEDGKHLKDRFCMHYPSQIAPAVAAEMAEYAGRWCRGVEGGGVERWLASSQSVQRLRNSLQHSGSMLYEETVET